jgi:hypothetical protein
MMQSIQQACKEERDTERDHQRKAQHREESNIRKGERTAVGSNKGRSTRSKSSLHDDYCNEEDRARYRSMPSHMKGIRREIFAMS